VVAVIGAVVLVLDGDNDVLSSFVVQKPRLFAGVVIVVVVVTVVRFGFVRHGVYVVVREVIKKVCRASNNPATNSCHCAVLLGA